MTASLLMEPAPAHGDQGYGARWCDEHRRWECVGNRSRGRGICHGTPPKGTRHCRIHAGKKTEVARREGEARISAWNALGATPNVDYRMAVLGVLQMTWLRLGAYSELLRRQVATEGAVTPAEPFDPDAQDGEEGAPATSGLIGYRFGAAGKDGKIYAQSEEVRALVALESAERDRVVKYAKTAHDMGISERLTSLAERWGDVVAGRITRLLTDLELTPEQAARVPDLVAAHLGSIDVEALEIPSPNGNGVSRRGVRDGGGPTR